MSEQDTQVVEQTTQVVQEPAQPAEVATPEQKVDEGAAPAEKPIARTYTQKEVDAIAARVAAREEKRAKRELEAERARWQQPAQKVEAPQPGMPQREQFSTYEDYIDARAAYVANQEFGKRTQEQEKAEKARQEKADQDSALKAFDDRMRKAHIDIPGFAEALEVAQTLPISDAAFNAIIRLEEGPQLIQFFGTNPQEAHRIASLHPLVQATEIGKLATKLANAPAPKPASVSKAPAPIEPLAGNTSQVSDTPPDDPEAFKKWHDARERQKRKRT